MFVGPDDWESSDHELDFRVGGREHVSGGPEGGPVHAYDAVIADIVANERIVTTYEMHMDDKRISVSVATMEFASAGNGTWLTYTEQGAFLDGYDNTRVPRAGHRRPSRRPRKGCGGPGSQRVTSRQSDGCRRLAAAARPLHSAA